MVSVFMQTHKHWLLIAKEDLDSAKHLFSGSFVTGLFHAQQCAEKSLKAYLVFKKNMIIKTHDLVRLIDVCMQLNENFETLRLFAVELTPYETAGRYPDISFVRPSEVDMIDLINQAESVFNFVIHQIEE